MKFARWINERDWTRRQLRKGKPYWVFDKYEITKEPDGFKLVDVSQMSNNKPKQIGMFDSLKKAKNSINESTDQTDLSFLWEEDMKEAVGKFNIGFEEMTKFYNEASPQEIKKMEKIVKASNWRAFKILIKQVLGVELH
jgi:hypothetical protein